MNTSSRSMPCGPHALADTLLVAYISAVSMVAVAELERRAHRDAVSSGGIWKTPKPKLRDPVAGR